MIVGFNCAPTQFNNEDDPDSETNSLLDASFDSVAGAPENQPMLAWKWYTVLEQIMSISLLSWITLVIFHFAAFPDSKLLPS